MKSLYERMTAARVTLEPHGDNLEIVAPGPIPPDLVTDLKAVRGDLLDCYRERAAIREYDGGLLRADAEHSAVTDLLARIDSPSTACHADCLPRPHTEPSETAPTSVAAEACSWHSDPSLRPRAELFNSNPDRRPRTYP